MAKLDNLNPYVKAKAEELEKRANERLTGPYEMRYTQGFRSKEEQDALYAQGRTKKYDSNGKKLPIVTNAPGGKSMHNFGLAVDFALFTRDGKKVVWDTRSDFDKDGKADWSEVVEEAKKLGFEWGGDWKRFPDSPHFQMTAGLTDKQVFNGMKPKFPKETVTIERPEPAKPADKPDEKPVNVKPDVKVEVTPKPIVPYPGKALERGSKGINVERVQRAAGLKEKAVDGIYGAETIKAVKAYQKKHNLKVDGIVGKATWNRMF